MIFRFIDHEGQMLEGLPFFMDVFRQELCH
jgi:hypothetical protein